MSAHDNVLPFPGEQQPALAETKECCQCQEIKPTAAFYRKKGGRLYGVCKACKLERCRRYRTANTEKTRAATRRSRQKKIDHYRQKEREYKKQNPQKIAAQSRRYRKTERGRAIARAGASQWRARFRNVEGCYTADEWAEQLSIQSNRCYWCKKRFTKDRPPTKEHLIPLIRGGPHVASNIVAACKSCNSRKKAKRVVLL